jgi:hypothetical protein
MGACCTTAVSRPGPEVRVQALQHPATVSAARVILQQESSCRAQADIPFGRLTQRAVGLVFRSFSLAHRQN